MEERQKEALIKSVYDRVRNIQKNIDLATGLISRERGKKEFIEETLPKIFKHYGKAVNGLKMYIDYEKHYTDELDENGDLRVVYTGIKNEDIAIYFFGEDRLANCFVSFNVTGWTLEEITTEILRRSGI